MTTKKTDNQDEKTKKTQLTFREIVKRFFEPVMENPKFLGIPFLRSIIFSFLTIYTIEVFKQAVVYMQNGEYNNLLLLIGIFIFVYISYTIFSYYMRNFGWASIDHEGLKLFHENWTRKFFLLDNIAIERLGTGKILGVMNVGFRTWNKMFKEITKHIPRMLIIGIYAFIQIWNMGGSFIFILLSCLIVLGFHISFVNKRAVAIRKKKTLLLMDYQKQFIKILMSKMEIVYSNKIDEEINRIKNICSIITKKNYKVSDYLWKMFIPTRWVSHLLKIAILLYGGWLIKNGISDFSQFVGLVATISVFQSQMDNFLDFYKIMTNDFVQVERLRNTFDNIEKMKDISGKVFVYKKGEFFISHLSFGYFEDKSIFENFSLNIAGGKKTALIGISGAGKTTLLKLLSGYIDPQKGEIEIDNQKLSDLSLKTYYQHIGYLTQDPSVFDGTIKENLLYALDTEPKKEEIDKIIKLSKCEFIYEFKDGLKTEIGERGVRLSGGQKQRLAIAKIMLKNPNIILLDEPTSALDSVSEQKVSQALNNLFEGKTVIVVAHRLQTVKEADEIIVLQEGKVVERGTHESLKRKKGVYREMLDLQTSF